MSGELLFRILDRSAFEAFLHQGRASPQQGMASFLDQGDWSLTRPTGNNYVLIDGSAFLVDAPWMYDGHNAFSEVPLAEAETATLVIPIEVVADWRRRIAGLPAGGVVARTSSQARDALLRLMDLVLGNDKLALTVQSLL